MLEGAIRAVYRRAAGERFAPLERHLREELRARAEAEADSGAQEVAAILRSLAERLESFCGEGAYAYLLDRETNVPADSPLLVFDTRRVPDAVLRPVIFCVTEHVTRAVEARRETALHAPQAEAEQMFAGRSILLIDEGWHVVQNAELGAYANDLARRARHLGLFLIVISQQLSDFDNEHGRALIRNSTMQLFLRQVAEELDYVQDALRLTDEEAAIISRLKTVKGSHSQAYFINGVRGRGALSIRVGPTEYWLSTSDPTRDVPERERAIERHGGDVWAAIAELAAGGEGGGSGVGSPEETR
jgi:type IV secretory pathway VirB4 component